MKTGVSLWVRLVRLIGVGLSVTVSVSAIVLIPFILVNALWTGLYEFFSGWIPGFSFSLPGDTSLPGGTSAMEFSGASLPYPPGLNWILERAFWAIAFLLAFLTILNSLIPMGRRIKNAGGYSASRLPKDHFANSVIESLRAKTGGPRASVWVIPVDGIQAFALSGPLFGHGIVIGRGIISTLPKDMVAWILAHEYGHIRHGDTWNSSFWILSMRSVYLFERLRIAAMNLLLKVVRVLPILRALTLPLFFLFRALVLIGRLSGRLGRLVFLIFDSWASRKMEYAADNYAAITIGPEIGARLFESMMGDLEPLFNGLFATHPALSKRAQKLRGMEGVSPVPDDKGL